MGIPIDLTIGLSPELEALIRDLFGINETNAKLDEVLLELGELKEQITMSTQDVLNKIAELKAQVSSIGDQITAKLAELQAQIDAGQDTTATMAALNDLGASLQGVDDLVPDLPPTP